MKATYYQRGETLDYTATKKLEAGDVVSARGFGKFELSEVGGLTRKGRVSIVLQIYV